MCSIIGFFGFKDNIKNTLNSIKILKNRGPDGCSIYYNSNLIQEKNISLLKSKIKKEKTNFCLGHNLLSLVADVAQPFIYNQNVFMTNCEIYNWVELDKKYNLKSKNDAHFLFNFLELKGVDNLDKDLLELDGVYAFAYLKDNRLILARDILGVKPLFYYIDNQNKFAFASESKALKKNECNFKQIKELEPKQYLVYDLYTKNLELINRDFYKLGIEHKSNYENLKIETKKLLIDAIKKRLPCEDKKIGVLFSAGVDSTFIAYVLKQLGVDFTCYTAKIEGGNIQEAEDLIYAKEVSKKYNFNLKVAKINIKDLEKYTIKVINTVENRDYIKISVALPFYLASLKAKKDKVKVMFSGLGSEEIFAGYLRHKKVKNPNEECVEGLKILHIRDLYRDDVVLMANKMELRLPFLDKKLIEYSLNIPVKYKLDIKANKNKIILRDIAKEIGIDEIYSYRQKKAAQYGSKFDKGLLRLAKNANLMKQEYLNSLDVDSGIEKVYPHN